MRRINALKSTRAFSAADHPRKIGCGVLGKLFLALLNLAYTHLGDKPHFATLLQKLSQCKQRCVW